MVACARLLLNIRDVMTLSPTHDDTPSFILAPDDRRTVPKKTKTDSSTNSIWTLGRYTPSRSNNVEVRATESWEMGMTPAALSLPGSTRYRRGSVVGDDALEPYERRLERELMS